MTWPSRARVIALVLVGPLVLAPLTGATTDAVDDAQLAQDALAFLLAKRGGDGNVVGAGPAYVVEAIAQLGLDPKAWPSPDDDFYSLLRPHTADSPLKADPVYKANARIAHAVGTAGYDARDVHGRDLVAELRAGYVGSHAYILDDAWAVLALRAAGVPASDPFIADAVDQLRTGRARDGGWGYTPAVETSGTDATGMVLAALAAAGHGFDERGVALLRAREVANGGYLDPTNNDPSRPNCQSTTWAIHGLSAMGASPPERALGFLRSLRNADGGFAQRLDDQREPMASDAWCTVEVLVLLAGAHFPLPGYAPGEVRATSAHALESATLRVDGRFTRAAWSFDDGTRLSGTQVVHTFETQGARAFSVLAEGPHHRWRTTGVLEVLSARPRVDLSTGAIDTLRHVEVVLDASRAHDPDGAVVHVEVAWGDGAVSRGAPGVFTHAYARPGHFDVSVRARDDAGHWSDPARVEVLVQNRPPSLEGLPSRVVADRVTGVQLPLHAADPEDDLVRFSWRFANISGDGDSVSFIPTSIGNDTLDITVTDTFGGSTTARVPVEVVNVPPTLARLELPAQVEADAPFPAFVAADDADGPVPLVEWRVGALVVPGPQVSLSLPAGIHEVTVRARDADGAVADMHATVVAAAPRASPGAERADAPVPPRLVNASVWLDGTMLRVAFEVAPAHASVWLLRDGTPAVEVRDGALVPLAGAREAHGVLEARAENLSATVAWGPLRVVAPPLAPVRVLLPPEAVLVDEDVMVRVAQHAEATEYRFDFGDGNKTEWSSAREATHAWARPGAYGVRVLARDAERVAETSVVVRVDAPAPPPPAPPSQEDETDLASSAVTERAPVDGAPPLMPAEEHRPVPAPQAALLLLALLALALARPRRRAPSAAR